MPHFEVQGHRGARGVAVENTLASFEAALDAGVTSIETDVHLTRDGQAILFHDSRINVPGPFANALVRSCSLYELRSLALPGPRDRAASTATAFATARGFGPFDVPTLGDLCDFVKAYASASSKQSRPTILDIELKRTPMHPEYVGDGFTGEEPAALEREVIAVLTRAGMLEQARIRSFDHRSVLAARQLAPTVGTALLVSGTVPANLETWLRDAKVDCYCPDREFVDAEVVRQAHSAGVRVIPYTANEPADWSKLVAFGVDGITTDYPHALITWLHERGTITRTSEPQ